MPLIDIGCIATQTTWTNNVTWINKDNPANATGKITSIDIWIALSDSANTTIATFYVVSGNNLSTRDYQNIGTVTKGSKQTFVVDLDVEEGDYIGFWGSTTPRVDNTGHPGLWRLSSNRIPCANLEFTFYADMGFYLYGTGTTVVGNALFFGANF